MNMSKRIITGIDIRSNSVLAITLAKKYDTYQLQMIQEIPYNRLIVTENRNKHHQIIVNILKKIKCGLPLLSSNISLSLPESAVISKKIELPMVVDATDQQGMVYQAFAKVSPLPVNELCLDFLSENGVYHVFAAKKDDVNRYLLLAEQSGLTLGLIDTEKQAYLQCLCFFEKRLARRTSESILIDIEYDQIRYGAMFEHQSLYRTVDIPESHHEEFVALENLVDIELQRILSFYSDVSITLLFVVLAPHYSESFFSAITKKLPFHCQLIQPFSFFKQNGCDVSHVNDPLIALGNVLRAYQAMEKNKYVV